MAGADDSNLFKFNENFVWDDFGNLHELLVPLQGGESAGVSVSVEDFADTSRHETENHLKMNSSAEDIANKNMLNKVITTSFSPLKIGCSSLQDRIWSQACNGIGSGCPSLSDHQNIFSTSALPSMNTRCFEEECHDRKDDLMDYDWPDIGNFEDIDRILRNCGSDGQRHLGVADELSWFSTSSEKHYDSGNTLESGLQSTCTEMTKQNDTLELHGGSANISTGNYTSSIYHHVPSNSGCQVPFEKCGPKTNEQVYDGKNRLCGYEISDMQVERQHLVDEKRAEQLDFHKLMPSNVSNSESYSSYEFSKQNQDDSMKMHNPYVEEDSNIPMLEISFRQPESVLVQSNSYHSSTCIDPLLETIHYTQCMKMLPTQLPTRYLSIPEENIEEILQDKASVSIENSRQQYNQASRASVQKNNVCHVEKEIRNGRENKTMNYSEGMNDSSISMASSSVNNAASGKQINETSFKQLQDVLDQVDGRIKQCIRDGLYRLARNAKHRHIISHENTCSSENNFRRMARSTESSERVLERGDLETDTNPIDRSIAHLLFHRPLEQSYKFASSSTSLQSHVINRMVLNKRTD